MDRAMSARIVWPLAAEEAMARKFEYIEPLHIFIAILKFSELDHNALAPKASDKVSRDAFRKERDELRAKLAAHRIDVPEGTKSIRKALRTRLGDGGFRAQSGWVIHRSESSRSITETAESLARKAGRRTVHANQLLDALLNSGDSVLLEVLQDAGASLFSKPPASNDSKQSKA